MKYWRRKKYDWKEKYRKKGYTVFSREPYMITESEIIFAVKNSTTIIEAAAFLRINPTTFKKYAKCYVDADTGKTWLEILVSKKKTKKLTNLNSAKIEDILAGKHPNYGYRKLFRLLIREMVFPEECSICGFCERRIDDYTVPLVLNFKDGNKRNHSLENMEFLCYNHYFLYVGDIPRFRAPLEESFEIEEEKENNELDIQNPRKSWFD